MTVNVKMLRNDNNATSKLADAELHFIGGDLDGLKPIGCTVRRRRDGNGCDVDCPAREFTVDGRRRRFPVVCSWMDLGANKRLRDLVLRAYSEHQASASAALAPYAIATGHQEERHDRSSRQDTGLSLACERDHAFGSAQDDRSSGADANDACVELHC